MGQFRKKNRFLVRIFDQFQTDFLSGISKIRLGPFWFLIRNHPNLADLGRVVSVPGLFRWEQPLGQAQPVPVGQADWDKVCLSQWEKYSLSRLGLGKVKRDLSLSHGTSQIPTLEAFPCPGTSSIPTMELVSVPLVPTCPNLSHKVGLQGRGKFRLYET